MTAVQAYEMWKAAPDKVKIIDVRTPEESAFVGHAEMAWNIPVAFVTYQRKGGKFAYAPQMNKSFVAQVKEIAKPSDVLLVTCRSGGRSAMAVNQLAAAAFTKVYNIVDGFEGDTVDDPDSVFHGKRMKRLAGRRSACGKPPPEEAGCSLKADAGEHVRKNAVFE